MSILASIVFKSLAEKLIEDYKGKLDDLDLIPKKKDLAKGLAILFKENSGFEGLASELVNIATAADIPDTLLGKLSEKVKEFQGQHDTFNVDGIIGRRLLNSLLNVRSCDDCDNDVAIAGLDKVFEGSSIAPRDILYWIEGPMPTVGGGFTAGELISIVWRVWNHAARPAIDNLISVLKATTKNHANVVIVQGVVDGQNSGRLARAHVGPPKGRQLTVTLDKAEVWNPLKFQVTLTHEFGHILGIRHADVGPNDLMGGPFVAGQSPPHPTAADVAAVKRALGIA